MLRKPFYLCILAFCTLLVYGDSYAQSVSVPSKMTFGNMRLTINSAAKSKIQTDVNRLRKSRTHFQNFVKKAEIYFPLIEEKLLEAGAPEDIKYLIIQESAFNANAVSSSNAVGYWQFKKPTALEVGLMVSNGIDERKNIALASWAAGTYIKRNNKTLDNWVNALISYNTGLGGVKKYINAGDKGTNHMKITGKTHWYFLKFLAHKVAFENDVKYAREHLKVVEGRGSSLKKIAKKQGVSIDEISKYNQWVSTSKTIPRDKSYPVAILTSGKPTVDTVSEPVVVVKEAPDPVEITYVPKKEPKTEEEKEVFKAYEDKPHVFAIINGRRTIRAQKGDGVRELAILSGLTVSKFNKYNEIGLYHQPEEGKYYFIQRKNKVALVAYHQVEEGETVWSVAQRFGMPTKNIRRFNSMYKLQALNPGEIIWLRSKRPENFVQPKDVPEKTEEVVKEEESTDKKEETVIKKEEVPNDVVAKWENHVVEQGQTLYAISRIYKVAVDDIKVWNGLSDNTINVGDVLKIKK